MNKEKHGCTCCGRYCKQCGKEVAEKTYGRGWRCFWCIAGCICEELIKKSQEERK